jgi:predicted dehydrogenase
MRSSPSKSKIGNRPIKIGIVGAGHIAERAHLPVMCRLSHAAPVAVYGANQDAA